MLILPKLDAPFPPLTTGDDHLDLEGVLGYLHTLIGYLYNCNAPLADDLLGANAGSAKYIEGTFTVTLTGFTTTIDGPARYVQVGKHVVLALPFLQGTSNSTAFTLTGIPAGILALYPSYVMIPTIDNGGPVNGMVLCNNTSTWTMNSNSGGGGWTAAGNKGIQNCVVSYISV